MNHYPSVVILTLHGKNGQDIVNGITGENTLPGLSTIQEGISSWPWEILNKYYKADIQLTSIENVENHKQWIFDYCEALIIYFNSSQNTALDDLNALHESLGDFEPEVQLLVCDHCSPEDGSAGLSRLKAQQWCISNQWELIELDKTEDENSDQEDDFPESYGYQRICQALHAHTWSNLEMKDSGKTNSLNVVMQSVVAMDEKKLENMQNSGDVLYSRLEDLTLLDLDSEEQSAATSRLHGDAQENGLESPIVEDDFEKLFSSFEEMKKTAASLPLEHRRDYAEKVAISFWKAIGGPDDELDGLDSD